MAELTIAREKAARGERLTLEDALCLYEENDLLSLAAWARAAKERKSGHNVFYNVNRHINLTNICVSDCPLCAFQCHAGDSRGYLLTHEEIASILQDAARIEGLTEIHIVSALHPTADFSYYLEVIRQVRAALPQVAIQAFTPVEIVHFSKITGKSVADILQVLKQAGLDSLPGGGAEILSDRVRKIICPDKATRQEWIDTVKTAHQSGIHTNATMLYGHVETIRERMEHLITLRDIQDQTGGFQAFVSFPFHPEHTKFPDLKRVGAWEDMKMMAISRLVLDNIDHMKAFWVMLTMPVAQLALGFGADDLDGTIGEEKIIHAAGAKTNTGITRAGLRQVIRETGYEPIERDDSYQSRREKAK